MRLSLIVVILAFVAQSEQDVVSEIHPSGPRVVLADARDGLDTFVSLFIRSRD